MSAQSSYDALSGNPCMHMPANGDDLIDFLGEVAEEQVRQLLYDGAREMEHFKGFATNLESPGGRIWPFGLSFYRGDPIKPPSPHNVIVMVALPSSAERNRVAIYRTPDVDELTAQRVFDDLLAACRQVHYRKTRAS